MSTSGRVKLKINTLNTYLSRDVNKILCLPLKHPWKPCPIQKHFLPRLQHSPDPSQMKTTFHFSFSVLAVPHEQACSWDSTCRLSYEFRWAICCFSVITQTLFTSWTIKQQQEIHVWIVFILSWTYILQHARTPPSCSLSPFNNLTAAVLSLRLAS